MKEHRITRRRVLEVIAGGSTALAFLPAIGCGSSGSDCSDTTGVDPAALSTRQSLHYVATATDPQRRCQNCTLYTAGQGGCGTCQAFAGPVSAEGSCDSFVARS